MNYRELRHQSGLKQWQVAEALNVDIRTVERWDSGKVQPSGENVVELLKLYGVLSDGFNTRRDRASIASS